MKKPLLKLTSLLGLLTFCHTGFSTEVEPEVIDNIVAVVNDDVILLSELQEQTLFFKRHLRSKNITLPEDSIMQKQVLERLITDQLQLQEAANRGIKIDDVMLNEAIKEMAAQNKMSLEAFRQAIITEGQDYTQFREELRNDITVNQIRQRAVSSNIMISEQEINDFLSNEKLADAEETQFLISHIMISIPEAATPDAINIANQHIDTLYKRLEAGEDFSRIALAESESQQALDGGSLGWKPLDQLPSLFAKAVSDLKPGTYTKPIHSASGFHILKLEDKKGEKRHVVPQVQARHILIKPNTINNDEIMRKKLLDLRGRIMANEDFAKLAKVHSEDPVSAANGGDLGWSSPEIYTHQFKKIVTTLPLNKISEPFQTEFGWHIVEVTARREHDDTEEYRRSIARKYVFNRKAAEEEELWLRRLKDEAHIEYRIEDGK